MRDETDEAIEALKAQCKPEKPLLRKTLVGNYLVQALHPDYTSSSEFTLILTYYEVEYTKYEAEIAELERCGDTLRERRASLEALLEQRGIPTPPRTPPASQDAQIDPALCQSSQSVAADATSVPFFFQTSAARRTLEAIPKHPNASMIRWILASCRHDIKRLGNRQEELILDNEDLDVAVEELEGMLRSWEDSDDDYDSGEDDEMDDEVHVCETERPKQSTAETCEMEMSISALQD